GRSSGDQTGMRASYTGIRGDATATRRRPRPDLNAAHCGRCALAPTTAQSHPLQASLLASLLRTCWSDDRRQLSVHQRRRVEDAEHLTARESVPVPKRRRPRADDRVEQILAPLVSDTLERRRLLDQTPRLGVGTEVEGRLGVNETREPPDQLIAGSGAQRLPRRGGHLLRRP